MTPKYYVTSPSLLLRAPFSQGTKWTGLASAGGRRGSLAQSEITAEGLTVVVPAGSFNDCIKVQTVINGSGYDEDTLLPVGNNENQFVRRSRNMWFAQGVGLIKVVYNHEDGTVTTIELQSYSTTSSSSYLPLDFGNSWTFDWSYSGYTEHITETHEIK